MFDWLFRNRTLKHKKCDEHPGAHDEIYQMDAMLPNGKPVRIAESKLEGESRGFHVVIGRKGEKALTSKDAPQPVDSSTLGHIVKRALDDDDYIYP